MTENLKEQQVSIDKDEKIYFSSHAKRYVYTRAWNIHQKYKEAFPQMLKYDFYLTNKKIICQ